MPQLARTARRPGPAAGIHPEPARGCLDPAACRPALAAAQPTGGCTDAPAAGLALTSALAAQRTRSALFAQPTC